MAYLKAAIAMPWVCIIQGHLSIAFCSNGTIRSCKISTDKQ